MSRTYRQNAEDGETGGTGRGDRGGEAVISGTSSHMHESQPMSRSFPLLSSTCSPATGVPDCVSPNWLSVALQILFILRIIWLHVHC
jgi:hypothetical protein